ncbi:MAG: Wzz/FepE/Etk N-terminal domain-containing protein, partial [Betaproteobacteria bacterium]
MDLKLFILALRARFGVFAFLLFVTVAAATTVSFLLPKSYTATVSLLVDAREEQSMANSQRQPVGSLERTSYLETQTDIITSGRVARKVVQDLNLAQRPMAAKAIKEVAEKGGSI